MNDSGTKDSPHALAQGEPLPASDNAEVHADAARVLTQRDASFVAPSPSTTSITPQERPTETREAQLRAARFAKADALCRQARAAQRSENAQLRSPWVSGRASTLQRGELSDGSGNLALRFRAGLGVTVNDWLRADILENRSEASCELLRLEAGIAPGDGTLERLSITGWSTESAALRQALIAGAKLKERSSRALQLGQRTVPQHLAVLRALRSLEERLTHAELQRVQLAERQLPTPPNPQQEQLLVSKAAELEGVEGALRRNRTLQLVLEAGYDEILGVEQGLPLYGQLTAVFRPGYFWQKDADEEGAQARAVAVRHGMAERKEDYYMAVRQAQAQRGVVSAERERLSDFIADLQEQYEALGHSSSPQGLVLMEQLWFELQGRKAELGRHTAVLASMDAWLKAHLPKATGQRARAPQPLVRSP